MIQTCFFSLSGVLPRDEAMMRIKEAIREGYGKRGQAVVEANTRAVDEALTHLQRVTVPAAANDTARQPALVPNSAPAFVREVTATLIAGR